MSLKTENFREYRAWVAMLARCYNPKCSEYRNYGARGISVCAEWRKDFAAFFSDMGSRPSGLTLERIDNNGNYEPANCKWETIKRQSRNRRNNRIVTYKGQTMTVVELAEMIGLPHHVVLARINKGWSEADLSRPTNVFFRRRPFAHGAALIAKARNSHCQEATL